MEDFAVILLEQKELEFTTFTHRDLFFLEM